MNTGTQMALFDTPAQEAGPPARVLEERLEQWGANGLVVLDPGPVTCVNVRCKKHGEYLKGGYVLCEKHLRGSVRSERETTKDAAKRHPHVLHCPDGFNTVEYLGRQDHQPLGDRQRVQVCRQRKCKAIFPVHWLWTGEPALCPACSAAAFREIYPDG